MKFLYALLVLGPLALVLEIADIGSDPLLFVVSGLALVPLAAVLGQATETMAVYTGPRIGALLNATFGNAAELIITIVVLSELLVGVIEPTAEAWGLSDLFVGVMLVPLVGNVAEHLVAVQAAYKNQMDLSLGIAVGSGLQIALFVTPVLVFAGVLLGNELTLVFNSFELAALAAATVIAVLISIDGESNWLEGVMLIAVYAIIGVAFFFVP